MTDRRRGRRVLVWAAAALAVTGGAGAALLLADADGPREPPPAPPGPARASVERTTLTERKTVRGRLGYAGRTDVTAAAPGRLTWRPRPGRVVRPGQRLYQVNGEDVILLRGGQPAYRRLRTGDEGADVRQFEQALAALGYTGFTVDGEYTALTADAVRRWQRDRGRKETGEVDPAALWYAEGPVRVDAHRAALGQPLAPGTPVLTLTTPRRVVTVPIRVSDSRLVRVGGAVTVTLPGGATVKGEVASIGSKVTTREGPTGVREDTVDVTVHLPGTRATRRFDRAPVEVSLVSASRRDVLVVPVTALVALPGGGYGVTLLGPGGARDVRVETGMFADGKVEVSAPGLAAGAQVEVAR
ncbi:Putative peptidoglycan binding domain 1 [[Actinomadura] parvosata subsp. kistnae]|uniref:efflux RND transporter periplasmic adaptor subunit n=1 Tax=[Actinomadura] parvosata TaxID=1955412 RepID=UPI000D2DA052|nr:Putative peptidoglycan binding domain 1 [Actinomadura parvosata subsp. kistnae]